jgi:hypothetical protein
LCGTKPTAKKIRKKEKLNERNTTTHAICVYHHTHTHTHRGGEFGRKEEKKGNDPHNIRFGFNPLRLFPPLSPY